MNPSTAQILEVIESVPGAEVVILPNNKNILAVAKQACELSPRPAFVVDTPGIQEGFAALLEYDPGATGEENAGAMQAAAAGWRAGKVTRAVRGGGVVVGARRGRRLDRAVPRRDRVGGRVALGSNVRPSRPSCLRDERRDRHADRGRGSDCRRPAQGDRVVARAPAGRLPRPAPRGPAAVPVPRLGRVSGGPGGRTLRFLAGKGVGELRSVKARKAAGARGDGYRDRSRPPDALPTALRRPAPPGRRSPRSSRTRRRW